MAKYRELRNKLKKAGFVYTKNTKGSHERWEHPSGVMTILTHHSGEISSGVERSIIKAIEATEE